MCLQDKEEYVMFNLFNESSVLPIGVLNIEKDIAKKVIGSTEFKLLCIRCESIPCTPKKYNILIGDTVYNLAKGLSERFEGDLDSITMLKFSEAFEKSAESRYLPVSRNLVENKSTTKRQMIDLWRHDLNMARIILCEMNRIKELANS